MGNQCSGSNRILSLRLACCRRCIPKFYSTNFRTGRRIPLQHSEESNAKAGRKENTTQRNAFLLTCEHFEYREEEQSTLADLVKKMDDLLKETEFSAYDPCYMKRKLEEFYGEDIIISGGSGLKTIVTYRKSVNSILREYYNTLI